MAFNPRALVCVSIVGLLGSGAVWASDAAAGLVACRDIPDASARLACYDRAAAASPAPPAPPALPAAPPAAPAVPAKAPPVLTSEQQFGMPEQKVAEREVAAGRRAADADKIEAHLASISQAADGRLVFTFDNAQVWRQLASEGEMLAKVGDEVTVSRGWLGSYWMQLKGGRGCKVTRLR